MCVCVCVCVRACMHACVRACLRVYANIATIAGVSPQYMPLLLVLCRDERAEGGVVKRTRGESNEVEPIVQDMVFFVEHIFLEIPPHAVSVLRAVLRQFSEAVFDFKRQLRHPCTSAPHAHHA